MLQSLQKRKASVSKKKRKRQERVWGEGEVKKEKKVEKSYVGQGEKEAGTKG